MIGNKFCGNFDKVSDVGESGNVFEIFIFKDYSTLDKLMATKKDLFVLNNINLLTKYNFDELRDYAKKLTKDVKLITSYDKRNEIIIKYKEKIKNNEIFKNKKLSEIRLSDLDIEELY